MQAKIIPAIMKITSAVLKQALTILLALIIIFQVIEPATITRALIINLMATRPDIQIPQGSIITFPAISQDLIIQGGILIISTGTWRDITILPGIIIILSGI